MRAITGAVAAVVLAVSACAPANSDRDSDSGDSGEVDAAPSAPSDPAADPCIEVLEAFTERSSEATKMSEALEGFTRNSTLRDQRKREANMKTLAAAYIVADHPQCFSIGDVADWRAVIPTLEGLLRQQ